MNVFRTNSNITASEQQKYILRGVLKGQRGAVACLTTHPLGFFVASGGEAGTKIWHLPSAKPISCPTGASDRGVTMAIVWLTRADDDDEGLAFGTEHALANSPSSIVQNRFTVKSVKIVKHWPQAVAFGQVGVRGPELWTFGREDGVIYILNDEGKILSKKTTGMVIIRGHAVLNTKDDAIILDDVAQGVALFKMAGSERVKTFEVPHKECRSRNVAFHDGTSTVISGSDHGNVYAFDRRTGDVIDMIYVGVKDWVQSILTVEASGVPLLFVGQSGENVGKTEIQMWEKVNVKSTTNKISSKSVWEDGCWMLLVILSCLFVVENVLNIPILNYFHEWVLKGIETILRK
ncbi:hypothetical protein F5050DRAFT_1906032 [Lentinula boryana]|uniref:WD40 repeat-like protein n=1 Tax=Lentinula boryana TaxID=40481 RepID=A0ABQ8PX27_9AGAR|nr:hypothetical protein F5050DRAFT_1906032 [Lentinula boryana]